ncbi:hypothetical protein [Pseudomonas fluorescens]|nr:hypothetical protein [Pseudomonas fluorescens]
MSRGIKMLSALDAANRPQSLQSLQQLIDTNQLVPPLRCDGKSCLTPVRFVPQRIDPKKENSVRSAYIGLTASVSSDHTVTCQYNALAQLNAILAAQSDPNFIGALDKGAKELRLLLMHNKIGGENQPAITGADSTADGRSAQRKSNNYKPTSTQLDSYLRTTADILKLRKLCEDDKLLAQTLILRFGQQKISWSDFYFEHGRYEDAWKMANKQGDACHPFAVMGTVEQFRAPADGAEHPIGWLKFRSERDKPNAKNVANSFSISVGARELAWLRAFPAGTEIIMFGVWKASKPTKNIYNVPSDPPRQITYSNHGLILYPKFHSQLFEVS